MGNETQAMVPIALANGLHFWALQPAEDSVPVVNKGDPFLAGAVLPQPEGQQAGAVRLHPGGEQSGAVLPPQKRTLGAAAHDFADEEAFFVERTCVRDEAHIDAELQLCNVLLQWSPFSSPEPDVLAAVAQLGAVRQGLPRQDALADAALARQHAISQLATESEVVQARTPTDRLPCVCCCGPQLLSQTAHAAPRRRRCRERRGSNAPGRTSRTWASSPRWRRRTT